MAPDTPQFSTAEYPRQSTPQRCEVCSTPLATEYYRVLGKTACASCAAAAQNGQITTGTPAFVRALGLGIAAAVVGLVVYASFTIATHLYVGYVALGVGYFVARAMKFGSGGIGGRPYQIAAVVLTYLSIALAEIPIGLWQYHLQYPAARLLLAGVFMLPTGLASPFLELRDPVHGLIGLVILFVGLRIAWRMTAAEGTTVEGPFRLTASAS